MAVLRLQGTVRRAGDPIRPLAPSCCPSCPSLQCATARCLELFEVTRPPAAVKSLLLRPVDAEVGEPAFARDGLDPLMGFSRWRTRAEEQVDCPGSAAEPLDVWLEFEQRTQSSSALTGVD